MGIVNANAATRAGDVCCGWVSDVGSQVMEGVCAGMRGGWGWGRG